MGTGNSKSKIWRVLCALSICIVAVWLPLSAAAQDAGEASAAAESPEDQDALDSRQQVIRSLISLSETLAVRQARLSELNQSLEATSEEAERGPIEVEAAQLRADIAQAREEIEIVVLGLQSREYGKIGSEQSDQEDFDLGTEIGRIFQPLVISLERATEPSRRMEELRQLSNRTNRRRQVAQATLDHIAQFRQDGTEYPDGVDAQIKAFEEVWQTRLEETVNLGNALDEQLISARKAKGSTLTQFTEDFGGFVLNRGASLLIALGSGVLFFVLCQLLRVAIANFYRKRHTGFVSAPVRIFGMFLSIIGAVGALMIAITIFNIRHDWLLLAMSLLLALAISWSFVRALPTLIEEARVLLNLGSVREGERTIVNGLPYQIERLSVYSRLVNPALRGGSLVFPVRELINMHSRPVMKDEAWFPTQIGDWIIRDGKHYEVIDQTPEHVIIRRPGGSEDFVPTQEFLDTLFETISQGYRKTHMAGISYKHLAEASAGVPASITQAVRKRVIDRVGEDGLLGIETRLVELGASSLDYKVLVDIGPGHGPHWAKLQMDITNGVVDACLAKDWEIPFPQLVVHKD